MLTKEPNATALLVVKRNARDEKVASMIKILYATTFRVAAKGFR